MVTLISSLSRRVVLSGAVVLCLLAAAAPGAPSDSLPALSPPENYYLSDSLTPGRQPVCPGRKRQRQTSSRPFTSHLACSLPLCFTDP